MKILQMSLSLLAHLLVFAFIAIVVLYAGRTSIDTTTNHFEVTRPDVAISVGITLTALYLIHVLQNK